MKKQLYKKFTKFQKRKTMGLFSLRNNDFLNLKTMIILYDYISWSFGKIWENIDVIDEITSLFDANSS